MDNFIKCENDCRSKRAHLSKELSDLFSRVYDQFASIQHSDDPIGQKKAGNCKLPGGVCLTKVAIALYETMGN